MKSFPLHLLFKNIRTQITNPLYFISFLLFSILNACLTNDVETSQVDLESSEDQGKLDDLEYDEADSLNGFLPVDHPAFQDCVDRVNELRASEGLDALPRNKDQERCNSESAQSDATSGIAHGAFGNCKEQGQNECPNYSSLEATLNQCINQMWSEKELGLNVDFSQNGHYLNMTNSRFKSMSCGFYITDEGRVWMIQNFWP